MDTTSTALDEPALLAMRPRQVDAAFRAAGSAPLPDGCAGGIFLWGCGTPLARVVPRLIALAWRGKVVDNARSRIVNRVTPRGARAVPAALRLEASRVDGRECVVLDYSRSFLVARMVRDELRPVGPGLFLGVIWVWRRRLGFFTLRFPGEPPLRFPGEPLLRLPGEPLLRLPGEPPLPGP